MTYLHTSPRNFRISWLISLLLILLSPTVATAAARAPLAEPVEQSEPDRPPLREKVEKALDWVAFGLGSSSLLLLGIGLIAGLGVLTLPGIILGVLSLGFSWWRRRWRKRKNWKTFIGQLAGSLALLTLLVAVGLVWLA